MITVTKLLSKNPINPEFFLAHRTQGTDIVETMLGSLNKLLLKLCDPRNSVSSPDANARPFRPAVLGRIAHMSPIKHPQHQEPAERCDTQSNYSHNLQSSINQLPRELLAEIFATICHADSDMFLGDRNRHKKTTPLVLGGICSYWRVVVLNNPRIWSHISLCLSSPSGRYGAQVSLVKEWFERSGICPLTINIVFQNEDDWTNEIAHELITLLVDQAHRWRSINFVLPEAWYPFLECTKDDVNQLTTVSTQPLWADCGLSPSRRKRLTLFENAPLLNDLHLNGYYLTDVFLRWSQLTRITLQHVYLDECFFALPLTPNLTWCRIYTILINDVNRTIVDPDRPIVLNELKKIIVYSAAWGDLMRLLSCISCVLLESFEISALLDDLLFSQLATVLPQLTNDAQHPSSLTRLVLSELDFSSRPAFQVERELKIVLQAMPNLEVLELEISKKADREHSAFCSWWFIDLLGVQEPADMMVEHGEGKERGRFGVGSWKPNVSDDPTVQVNGNARLFRRSSRDPGNSTLPQSPSYILPNLQSFSFSGSIIVYSCANNTPEDTSYSTGDDSESSHYNTSPHHTSFHRSPPGRGSLRYKDKEKGFLWDLMTILSIRGGFGSEWFDTLSAANETEKDEIPSTLIEHQMGDAEDEVITSGQESTSKAEDMQKIYFLDDEDKIRTLPADVLPQQTRFPSLTSPCATTTTTTEPLPRGVVDLPENLLGGSGPPPPLLPWSTTTRKSTLPLNLRNRLEGFNLKVSTLRYRSTKSKVGVRKSSKEVKSGLNRLVEEGGMKIKVVLGGETWI